MSSQPPNSFPPSRLVLPASDDASSSPGQFTQQAPSFPEQSAGQSPTVMTQGMEGTQGAQRAQGFPTAVNRVSRPRITAASIPSMPRVAPPGMVKTDWRKDPAYKFLFIAIGVVLLACIIFVSFAGASISSLLNQNSSATSQTNSGGSAQGTVAAQPTFPTPNSKGGSTVTSQPTTAPSPTTIPSPNPTPTLPPSPTATQAPQLTLQIVNSPGQANNGSQVFIGVAANQAGVQVRLTITYDGGYGINDVSPKTTNDTGHVTFQWVVFVYSSSGHGNVYAHITAVAQNQNGQQVTSQTVTVKIVARGQF